MQEVTYPKNHAELDAIASEHGIPINTPDAAAGSSARSTWGDGSIKTVDEKIAELERRGISPREARHLEAFMLKANVNRVELNEGHLDETIVLTSDKPYETSDPAVIAALLDHPAVKRVGEDELEELASDDDGA